jgi:hypothetical protein
MKAYKEVDVEIHVFLTYAPIGWKWSTSHSCRFTPGEPAPRANWVGGWVDPRTGIDDMEKWNFLNVPELELRSLGRPARSQ